MYEYAPHVLLIALQSCFEHSTFCGMDTDYISIFARGPVSLVLGCTYPAAFSCNPTPHSELNLNTETSFAQSCAQAMEEHLQTVLQASAQKHAKLEPTPDLIAMMQSGGVGHILSVCKLCKGISASVYIASFVR